MGFPVCARGVGGGKGDDASDNSEWPAVLKRLPVVESICPSSHVRSVLVKIVVVASCSELLRGGRFPRYCFQTSCS
jgi:hypothetical protein